MRVEGLEPYVHLLVSGETRLHLTDGQDQHRHSLHFIEMEPSLGIMLTLSCRLRHLGLGAIGALSKYGGEENLGWIFQCLFITGR